MFREIRRKDRLVSEETALAVLKECEYGVLSVLGDEGYPYGVPLNYAYLDGCIYMHGFLEGHKIDAVRNNPKACFTVVKNVELMVDQISTNYTSVIAFGAAEVVPMDDEAGRRKGFDALMDRLIPNEKERTDAYTSEMGSKSNIIRLKIEHMTCKHRNVR